MGMHGFKLSCPGSVSNVQSKEKRGGKGRSLATKGKEKGKERKERKIPDMGSERSKANLLLRLM
jgi:hypothetical protein